ncbi:hypothetical protein ACHAXR_003357, partial [Thalassiosira sp. AJA248-18]
MATTKPHSSRSADKMKPKKTERRSCNRDNDHRGVFDGTRNATKARRASRKRGVAHGKMMEMINLKPVAGVIILVLVASTCLRFHSWDVLQRYTDNNISWESPEDSQRRRLGQTIAHPHTLRDEDDALFEFSKQAEAIVIQTYNEVKRMGYKPGTKRFGQLILNRASRRVEKLDLASQSTTLGDRTYRSLEASGFKPGSTRFNKMFRNKMKRRASSQVIGRVKMLSEKIMASDEDVKEEVRRTLKETKDIWLRGNFIGHHGGRSNTHGRGEEIAKAAAADNITADELQAQMPNNQLYHLTSDTKSQGEIEPLTVCDRPADVGSVENFESLQENSQCTEITQDKPIVILQGDLRAQYGRTGNNLIEFLHAIQMARDKGLQLGVMTHSWAMDVLQKMWMSIDDLNWQAEFEQAFCIKIFEFPFELQGWDVIQNTTKELFYYTSEKPLDEYIDNQELTIRTLFRDHNQGEGYDSYRRPVNDMCSGIKAVFGEDRATAIYSVIHSRKLEGQPGLALLKKLSNKSGCDKIAALEMRPDYVKSILKPLGMLKYPI